MKKKLLSILLVFVLLAGSITAFASCEETSAPGIAPSSIRPASDATYDIGRSNLRWRNVHVSGNFSQDAGVSLLIMPTGANTTIVGLTNTQTLTNKTLTSPNISGTPVVSNHASGNQSVAASSTTTTVTHGLGSTPTRVYLQVNDGTLGTASSSTGYNHLYWSGANSTSFVINSMVATNSTVGVNWLAYISDE